MTMNQSPSSQLWLPSGNSSSFRKAPPPVTGPGYGAWSGPGADLTYLSLPGGGILQFDLSRLTLADYRSMRDHYQINISLAILTFTMHQMDWQIECDDARIKDHVETNLREVWTRLIRGVGQAYWAGFSPMAIQYDNNLLTGKIDVTKFKDLPPETSQVNWKTVKGASNTGDKSTPPKRYIYDGIKQDGQSGHIPVENSLWYPLLMENGNYAGRKLLKAAFPSWFFSQLIHLFANRYFERFGEPLPIGRAPFDDEVVDTTGTSVSGREAMEGIITSIRNRAAVVLPSDRAPGSGLNGSSPQYEYEIEYLESQMRGVDFERYMTRLDEEMSIAMFMPVLLFRTADVGSYNLGQAHERMFMLMMNALAGDFKEYLDRYVLDRMVDFNFSPNAPRARFVYRPMGKVMDETLRAVLQSSIQQAFVKPDVEDLGQAVGLKLEEIHEVMDTEPTTPAEPDQTPPNADLSATLRRISARVESQTTSAFRKGKLDEFVPSPGHEAQLAAAVPGASQADIDSVLDRVNAWGAEAVSAFDSAPEFLESYEKLLSGELAGL